MGKQSVNSIHISTTVTLKDHHGNVLTSVTTAEETNPGVFSSVGDANVNSAVSKIHDTTKTLGERIAVQAVAGLKDLDY